jgi:hypothetical protein
MIVAAAWLPLQVLYSIMNFIDPSESVKVMEDVPIR